MKQTLFLILVLCGTFVISNAQNNLFSNISTTDEYHRFSLVQDTDGDGVYEISKRDLAVKFNLQYLPTGEGYSCKAVIEKGESTGKTLKSMNALQGYATCVGYPYESVMRDRTNKEGLIAIGDYVFIVNRMSDDGTSFKGISKVFIKVKQGAEKKKETKGKKKKLSLRKRLKALKDNLNAMSYGAAHKELQSKNLDKFITDYLVTMKSKQNGRTATEKKKDDNLEAAKKKDAAEIKAYNDKIKASPEYKKLKEHQKRMERMDARNDAKTVTIENRTGKDIYVYQEGSRNSTTIRSNSRAKLSCSHNYTYKFDQKTSGRGTTCHRANSRCNGRVVVK